MFSLYSCLSLLKPKLKKKHPLLLLINMIPFFFILPIKKVARFIKSTRRLFCGPTEK